SATPPAPPSATATSVSPTVPPFSSGTFELVSDVTVINVTVAALGADPVRVPAPDGSGLKPKLSRDGSTVRLSAQEVDTDGSGRLDVRLNNKITWSLRMT